MELERQDMAIDPSMESGRRFLKAFEWKNWKNLNRDEEKKVPVPPIQKGCPQGLPAIGLIRPDKIALGGMPLIEAIRRRKSRRRFEEVALTFEEISFLVWATQGIREPHPEGRWRTVPSGGARHPFETYLAIRSVEGLEPGLYRYVPSSHELVFLQADAEVLQRAADGCCRQRFIKTAAVAFIWTAIPYRTEWRYSVVSHKVIAMDAGHLCQNLYLAAESIGAGTCAVGAYDQEAMDALLAVDGSEEFVVYVAPVGKVAPDERRGA